MAAKTCSDCSRLNPPQAAHCYHDGAALTGGGGSQPVGSAGFPRPFVLPSGEVCRSFAELARGCRQNWGQGRGLLRDGALAVFFASLGRADLANEAHRAARHPDLDRGLDDLLAALPESAALDAALHIDAPEVDLGVLEPGKDHTFTLTIHNRGQRLLYGCVHSDDCLWLRVGTADLTEKRFKVVEGRVSLPIYILGKHLRAKATAQVGQIVVESNGGEGAVRVKVRVPVRPFPGGVLAGANTPRELATKAKAMPAEAAKLLEDGAVARWYQSNGWAYPIRGPMAPGLAAVQQYFEALGLTTPPRVELATPEVVLNGRPGGRVEGQVVLTTRDKRAVYGHGKADQSWVAAGPPTCQGTRAVVPLIVAEVPGRPGSTLEATVALRANGTQRFTVPVRLKIDAGEAAGRAPAAEVIDLKDALVPEQGGQPGGNQALVSLLRWLPYLAPLGLLILVLLGIAIADARLPGRGPDDPRPTIPDEPITIPEEEMVKIQLHRNRVRRLDDEIPASFRFGILTQGPTGRDARLTYDPVGLTNNTCLRIDDQEVLFGEGDKVGKVEQVWQEGDEKRRGDRVGWIYRPAGVRVTQTVEVVPGQLFRDVKQNNQLTRLRNTCLVRYRIHNEDDTAHRVGLRFLLDTYIGNNDGVPFVIPGRPGLCSTQCELSGSEVPDHLLAVERYNPEDASERGTVVNLQLRRAGLEPPDRVTLGAWPHPLLAAFLDDPTFKGRQTLWRVPVVPIDTLHSFRDDKRLPQEARRLLEPDSAVVMYWPTKQLGPGEERWVGFACGLGTLTADASVGGLQVTSNGDKVEGQPFTILALVNEPQPGQTVTLTLPGGVTLEGGGAAEQAVPKVPAGSARKQSTVTWTVRAARAGVYTIKVSSSTNVRFDLPVQVEARRVFGGGH